MTHVECVILRLRRIVHILNLDDKLFLVGLLATFARIAQVVGGYDDRIRAKEIFLAKIH